MTFVLPPLPYSSEALEPHMSARTFSYHHGKHHAAYVNTANTLVKGTPYEKLSLEDAIKASHGKDGKIFNNVAQIWNHTFFWNSMTPAYRAPEGALKDAIARDFGGLDKLRTTFVEKGVGQFGSGWVWLIARKGELEVTSTKDAECPLVTGGTALLTCDVWEHAYYLDQQNDRKGFLETFFDKLANWSFAAGNLAGA